MSPDPDDRAAFEAAFKKLSGYKRLERAGDHYFSDWAECAWQGWKLRAAPSPAPASQPVITKTDLARLWREVNGAGTRWPSDVDAFVNELLKRINHDT